MRWLAGIIALCAPPVAAMYEDEVGMHDWALKNVGPPSAVHFASHNRMYVGTPAGVAALSVNDGDILWRHMGSGAVRDLVVVQKVVAVSLDKAVRAYKPSSTIFFFNLNLYILMIHFLFFQLANICGRPVPTTCSSSPPSHAVVPMSL